MFIFSLVLFWGQFETLKIPYDSPTVSLRYLTTVVWLFHIRTSSLRLLSIIPTAILSYDK